METRQVLNIFSFSSIKWWLWVYFAWRTRHAESLKILAENGANLNTLDVKGKWVTQLLERNGHLAKNFWSGCVLIVVRNKKPYEQICTTSISKAVGPLLFFTFISWFRAKKWFSHVLKQLVWWFQRKTKINFSLSLSCLFFFSMLMLEVHFVLLGRLFKSTTNIEVLFRCLSFAFVKGSTKEKKCCKEVHFQKLVLLTIFVTMHFGCCKLFCWSKSSVMTLCVLKPWNPSSIKSDFAKFPIPSKHIPYRNFSSLRNFF